METRKIPGHLDYEIDECGAVRSLDRTRMMGSRLIRLRGKTQTQTLKKGYFVVKIEGCQYSVHKLVALAFLGISLDVDIDHADRVTTNNHWSNLRRATKRENRANSKCPSTNTTGHKGVVYFPSKSNQRKPWRARGPHLTDPNKRVHIGMFETAELASAAYDAHLLLVRGSFAATNEDLKSIG